ncbi:putative nucleotide-diphospho-sugar transferase [Rhodohalobacter barkolensis]|uniref:Uncharacterized protein n=1 Tax=Rhodohalobacter barkolensis TaxID=2053187 RepID=A0A2N0VGH0_9BACT|nr:putative nucleotide-diphospho-sugar transferase [Rhodohalobacter barkolensis]PKD43273.1 hypothetical protein CWD77_11705 [Rhodohalobacter barkolensis]
MLKIIKRITGRAKKELTKITKYLRFHGYHNLQVLRKTLRKGHKSDHIIICGPDLRGSSILHDVIRNCTSSINFSSKKNISALDTQSLFKKSILTYEPTDLFSVNEIDDLLSKFRNLKFIVIIRDPRSLLTEVHPDIPWQYFQSWDYGFYIEPNQSFTRPGVGKAFNEIERLKEAGKFQFKIIRYEDFLEKPDDIQDEISEFADIEFSKSFSDCLTNTDKFDNTNFGFIQKKTDQISKAWKSTEHAERLNRLSKLFPDILEYIKKHNYPIDEKVNDQVRTDTNINNGTLVAMHTPDKVYTNEAKRMRASLDRLGIKHSVDELPGVDKIAGVEDPENYPDWFIQKLARYYKPTWLRKKRQQIRGALLYCDVDAFIHKNPWEYLHLYEGDMAVFSRRNGDINSGTIWINDTEGAKDFLKLWEKKCLEKRAEIFKSWPNVKPSPSDQVILTEIVIENNNLARYKIQRLPPSMLHIFPFDGSFNEDIYIEHLQASRVAKSKVSQGTRLLKKERDRRIIELEDLF